MSLLPPFTHVGNLELNWKNRGNVFLPIWYVIIPVGDYSISAHHSEGHYCSDSTVEIAIYKGAEYLEPSNAFYLNTFITDLFAMDNVAGWVSSEDLAQLINELQSIPL